MIQALGHSALCHSITFKTCYNRHNFILSVDVLDAVTLSVIMPDVIAPQIHSDISYNQQGILTVGEV